MYTTFCYVYTLQLLEPSLPVCINSQSCFSCTELHVASIILLFGVAHLIDQRYHNNIMAQNKMYCLRVTTSFCISQ